MSEDKVAGAPIGEPAPIVDSPTSLPIESIVTVPDPVVPAPKSDPPVVADVQTRPADQKRTDPLANNVPEPKSVKTTSAADDDLGLTVKQMRKEIDAAKKMRAEFIAMRDKQASEERVRYLRSSGILGQLSDEQILAIAPDADVSNDHGQQAIEEWRKMNPSLFSSDRLTGKQQTEHLSGQLQASRHGTFGTDLQKSVLRDMFGGER